MKAILNTMVSCAECNVPMNRDHDIYVKCNTIKCSQRGKRYHAPSVKLEAVKPEKKASKDES